VWAKQNVVFTGVAGTGKSFVLERVIQMLQRKYADDFARRVGITAFTGIAAVPIQGMALHRFAGCALGDEVSKFAACASNCKADGGWGDLEVLVVEEMSMVPADFLDWLDVTVRDIRKRPSEAFGGVQLIFCGDFAQLSPISSKLHLKNQPSSGSIPLGIKECHGYCFQTQCWVDARFCVVELTKVYRQRNQQFVDALGEIRRGQMSAETNRMLSTGLASDPPSPAPQPGLPSPEKGRIIATQLHATNKNVNRKNAAELGKLAQREVKYTSHDQNKGLDHRLAATFQKECIAQEELTLKVGGQGMLLCNYEPASGLMNGSRGVVIGFHSVLKPGTHIRGGHTLGAPALELQQGRHQKLHVEGEEEKADSFEAQLVEHRRKQRQKHHRAQLLERGGNPPADSGGRQSGGDQGNIAAASGTSAGASCRGVAERAGVCGGHGYYATEDSCTCTEFPIVLFMNGADEVIYAHDFEYRPYGTDGGYIRTQVPLKLAWAMAIHKSQGMSLDSVHVDLGSAWPGDGMVYVALSRARSLEGLYVSDWNAKLVRTSPLVLQLYSVLAARGEGEDQDNSRSSALQRFVEGVPKWWEPILASPEWLACFRTNNKFRRWTRCTR
jgi:ATP-dependent DNA helicase PIF1